MHLEKLIPILVLAISIAVMPEKDMGIGRGGIEPVSEENANAECKAEQCRWTDRMVSNVYGVDAKYVSKYDDIDKLCSIDEAELPENEFALIIWGGADPVYSREAVWAGIAEH